MIDKFYSPGIPLDHLRYGPLGFHLDGFASLLFDQGYATHTGRQKIRLVGVRTSNLERAVFQRSLIDAAQHEKLDKVLKAADKVRQKFGFDTVQLARSLEPGASAKPRKRRDFLGRE